MNALVNPYRVLATSAATRTLGHVGHEEPSLFERLVTRLKEQRRYRRTINELSALTDRELDDIGLTRGDIENVARRSARIV